MSLPLLLLSNRCCENINESKKFQRGMALIDTVACLTLLVVGILGLMGTIALSPAASYGMLGGASAIFLLYFASMFKRIQSL